MEEDPGVHSFLDETKIVIRVFPFNMDYQKFTEYLAALQKVSVVDLRDVYRDGTRWTSGKVHYEFVSHELPRSQWEDFKSSTKVMGVIGVSDMGASASSRLPLFAAFDELTSNATDAFMRSNSLLIGVNPPSTYKPFEEVSSTGIVVAGDDSGMKKCMSRFTAKLLMGFESRVYSCVDSSPAYIATPFDFIQTAEDVKDLKQKRRGRMVKQWGDICLQSGQLLEAIELYEKAIAEGLVREDWEWVAAAREGQCAALMALSGEKPERREPEIRKLAQEALTLYAKRGDSYPLHDLLRRIAHSPKEPDSYIIMRAMLGYPTVW